MADELRDEFEQYVKNLTSAIFKDILLDKLQDICLKYEEQYRRYSEATDLVKSINDKNSEQLSSYLNATSRVTTASKSLIKEVDEVNGLLNSISGKTDSSIDSIRLLLAQIETDTKKLLTETELINKKTKDEFIYELAYCFEKNKSDYIDDLNKSKSEFAQIFKEREQAISDKLAGVITPELLQTFINKLEDNTEETKKMVSFINDDYKGEIEKSILAITEANRKAMVETDMQVSDAVRAVLIDIQRVHNEASEDIGKNVNAFEKSIIEKLEEVLGYFSDLTRREKQLRDKSIEQQKELISKIEPSKERLDLLGDRISRMEAIVNKLQNEGDEYYRKIGIVLKNLAKQQTTVSGYINDTIPSMLNQCKNLEQQGNAFLKQMAANIEAIPKTNIMYGKRFNFLFSIVIIIGIINIIIAILLFFK